MKSAILVIIVLLVAIVPVASAAHSGPCTHEYVDYYKQLVKVVIGCLQRGVFTSSGAGVHVEVSTALLA